MKLIILLSVSVLVSCEYPAAEPEGPSDSYGAPAKPNCDETNASPTLTPIDQTKYPINFQSFYHGALPPFAFPPSNFFSSQYLSSQSFKYPFKPLSGTPVPTTFGIASQGILPPLTEIFPPITQIVPPIFGNTPKPVIPSPIPPPQVFPPQSFPSGSSNLYIPPKYTYNYAFPFLQTPLSQYSYNKNPYSFSFPPSTFLPMTSTFQKQPAKHTESLSTSYGPPASTPVETSAPFEPEGTPDSSTPLESSPVSYPYEPAAPEVPEQQHKPAQEYGIPNK